MKHLILGTAGHIDHGKTSLVKALTGIDTDRLKEEKARGITIELGFAHLELPDGVQFGIVDVPGHERFVRAMVAGVGGMDLVMLVIAADEGVMPQTREHLEICQLLGVRQGLVALAKCDMVDEEWLHLVMEEVRDYLAGSFLEQAPIIPVSSKTGAGLDELKATLGQLAAEIEEKPTDGPFRLPVDRVFTVAGFGTVVTGTLLSGEIATGDEVEILPSGLTSRVRSVQTHGKKSERGSAGQRLAVNLQGADYGDMSRGDVVVPRGVFRATRTVDARIDYLSSAPRDLKHRATLRLHSATYEVPAQIILLDRDTLAPGDSAFVQLRLRNPVLLLPGDLFIVRSYSPQITVGGGVVIDPAPPRRRRRSAQALELLDALSEGADADKLLLLVRESLLSGLSLEDLVIRSGLPAPRAEAALAALLSQGEIVQALRKPRIFLAKEAFERLKCLLLAGLEDYVKDNPHKEGIGKEELKACIPKRSDIRFFPLVLHALEKDGTAQVDRDLVKKPGHKAFAVADRGELLSRLEAALAAGGTEPPTIKELCETVSGSEKSVLDYLNLLVREGRVAKVKADLFYDPETLRQLQDKLVGFLRENDGITPPQFRELTGLSRKYMIPLLEYFDQEKITIRVGDKRVLRKR
ncbi:MULTISPECIES: selenocysteine-specific translation elongation factor [Syntrophotalea]|jgi:selenocysteine-specific elongation factor|uniref:Selenocysteine-specific elongation factor n=1 Tax=Syntrophotalea acetylenica TaxID=29542 RepID=A0A1L3GCM3_SYNAC|nr:selenocysteine-specific translation elongation factor [Syntrophotalea acetylenica]APG23657.1 selenocysteine-specific translation elongation factor [Syntrophotalea acetylenica]APG44235.1 selenocysteine-specific translation factor [Syntrophotalea acetylenica]MDY0263202.1 selenocysteine-specific translation elongation factor [Syntrophotalea acetylenica]